MKPTTITARPFDCEEPLLQEHFDFNIYVIKPGDSFKLNRVKIEIIRAYSTSELIQMKSGLNE